MFSTYGELQLNFSTIPMLKITELGFCLAFALLLPGFCLALPGFCLAFIAGWELS
jgi:hypothetical protein